MLYTENDLNQLKGQINSRRNLLILISAVLTAGIVAGFVLRQKPLTMALTAVLGFLLIFFIEIAIRPISAYARYVGNMLHGRTHELEAVFRSFSRDTDVVDGVRCHAVSVTDETGTEPCERLFYFDDLKEFPSLTAGARVRLTYHDRELADIRAIGSAE